MYKRSNSSKNKKTTKQHREKNKKQQNTAHPAGTWDIFIRGRYDIYSRSGPGLDILYFCVYVFLEVFLFVSFCFYVLA